jgi:hypothetical protein
VELSKYVLEPLRKDEEFILYRGQHRNQDRLVRQRGVEHFAQSPGFHHCYKRLERYRWPVVVRVALRLSVYTSKS